MLPRGASSRSCRELTHDLEVVLLAGTGGTHRVRLSRSGLAVCQQRDIVSGGEGVHAVLQVFPHAGLVDFGGEDAVEDEDLAALRRIDGEGGVGHDLDHRFLKSLRDEVEARVGRLEWGPDANGCREVRVLALRAASLPRGSKNRLMTHQL